MLLGLGPPRGPGVVHQDINTAQALHRLLHQAGNRLRLGAIGRQPLGINALGLQRSGGTFQLGGLAGRFSLGSGARLEQVLADALAAALESAYGAAGSLAAVLVWCYASAQIFLYGACVLYVQTRRDAPAALQEPAP